MFIFAWLSVHIFWWKKLLYLPGASSPIPFNLQWNLAYCGEVWLNLKLWLHVFWPLSLIICLVTSWTEGKLSLQVQRKLGRGLPSSPEGDGEYLANYIGWTRLGMLYLTCAKSVLWCSFPTWERRTSWDPILVQWPRMPGANSMFKHTYIHQPRLLCD